MEAGIEALRATPRARAALAFSTFIVDLQPDVAPGELGGGYSQCSDCSFVDFLRGVETPARHRGLEPLSRTFEALPRLADAYTRGDARGLARLTTALGARRCYEIVDGGAHRLAAAGVPALHVLDGGLPAAPVRDEDWLVVQPDDGGPERAVRTIEALARRGHRRIVLGCYQHAASVVRWTGFCERPGVGTSWQALLARLALLGTAIGVALAYPPCALLQVPENLALERLRARLDTHFRRLADDASRMCPENVSGYGLVNDVRDVGAGATIATARLSVRYEQFLLAF